MISKRLFLYAAFCMGVSLPAFPWQGRIEVTTPHTQMLLHANEGRDLRLDYFGSRISILGRLLLRAPISMLRHCLLSVQWICSTRRRCS